jgi:2-methylcitrate dehydratase PrpD
VAEEGILETRQGFFEVYGGTDGEGVMRDLGKEWDIITDMAIKLVPGGHPSHALAEAAANAARAGNVCPDEVETITLSRPGVTALSGPLHPTDLIDMAHSPAYFLAAGVADKDFSWVHATEAKITDPVIHQLLDKVRVGEPPTEHLERYKQGATVTIRTKGGRLFSNTVYAPRGSGVLGIDWADVDAKYRTLVPKAQLSDRQVEESLHMIHEFRQVTHVSALTDLLHEG